jgi:hypothetical protein
MSAVWIRSGRVLAPPDHLPWVQSHAMVPTVRVHEDERVEVLFSPRDADGRSHVARAWFDAMPGEPRVMDEPLLSPGPLGAFDERGVNPSCLVRDGDRWLLFFIGWRVGVDVRFQTAIGCATSEDDGQTFVRVADGPVVGCSREDPYFATSPWVMREGARWRMWYASGVRWEPTSDGARPHYRIRHAESDDGMTWRPGDVSIDFSDAAEHAIARPCVTRDDAGYQMWFSHRGSRYRIGYAESADGDRWVRKTEPAPPEPSGSGWDAEMVEYPVVFRFQGSQHMLYNGDGYGRTGIGHAILEDAT